MKRFLLFIALLISVLGLNAQSAIIDYGTYSLDFEITSTNPAECSLIGYSKMDAMSLTIPSTVVLDGNEYTVTSIGDYAFNWCESLTSIDIPNSVTSIGDDAFGACSSLTSIEIPNSVISIGNYAFEGCGSLTSVFCFAEDVPATGEDVFYGCPDNMVIYVPKNSVNAYESTSPWNLYTILDMSAYCNVTVAVNTNKAGVVTGAGPYEINDNVTVTATANEGCTFLNWTEDGEVVSEDAEYSFVITGNRNLVANFDVPILQYIVTNNSPAECEVDGFFDKEYTSLTIPSTVVLDGNEYTVTSIGDFAFYYCSSLTSIEIPNSVTSIGNYAFNWCESLTSIVVDEDNTVYDSRNNCNAIIETASNTLIVGCMNTAIPNSVTSIGDGAFRGCSSLTSIEIPNSVTSIGDEAFWYCSSLTSIEIPNSVTSIGNDAFNYCSSLTSIAIPNSVTSIGDGAFGECSSLTSIAIPNSVTSIGDYAFSGCSSLASIEIPNSVTSIGNDAFNWCSSLTSIVVDEDNTVYDSRNNCNAIIETASNTLIVGCMNTAIPNSVTSIGDGAFYHCSSLTSIEIPNSVTSIGDEAFKGCRSLTSIEIPNSVTSIGDEAFESCSSLTSIEIPNSVTSIGMRALGGCESLTSIDIPNSVTSIGDWAFSWCSSLTSIEIPNSVTFIGESAFEECESLTIVFCFAEDVPATGEDVFYGCPDNMVICVPKNSVNAYESTFPWNLYTILDMSAYCNVTVAVNTNKAGVVTGAGPYEINDNVTVTATANEGCTFLNWTEDGEVVSEDAEYSFVITGNRNLVANFDVPILQYIVTNNSPAECEVDGFFDKEYTLLTIPSTVVLDGNEYTVTSIGDYAFDGCRSLTSIEIPNSVTSIGGYAFRGCSSLTGIEIPNSVTSIGDDAFRGCSSLTSIEIPNSVTSIGDWAFSGCDSLTSIDIPNSVTSIGNYVFNWCESLTSIEIPNSVTSIGMRAFGGCESLTSIVVDEDNAVYDSRNNCNAIIETASNTLIVGCMNTAIPNSVTSIGDWAFVGCSSLTSIDIPNSVTSIGDGAFSWCESLTSIDIPNSVTSIGDWAFSWCPSLTSIAIPNSVTSIGYQAFEECESLTSVFCFAEDVPATGEDVFYGCPDNIVIYVPKNSVNAYESTSPWNLYTIIGIDPIVTYNVTAIASPEEAGIITGDGNYNHGEKVILTVTPNEPYKFVNWTENGEVVSEEAEYSFEITKDRNLVANFELLSYNVTASVNPENAGVVNGAGTYNHGEEVALTATANEGYKFVNWTENGEVVSEDAQYSFVVTSDRNLVANFEKKEVTSVVYNVTTVVNPENVGVVIGSGVYYEGDNVTLTAIPIKNGYEFVNWTESGVVVSEDAQYSFVVTSDRNLVANFEKKEVASVVYNVTTVVNPENVGVVIGSGVYYEGDNVILTAIPIKNGYEFVNWTEDGKVVSEDAQYSFVATSDRELVANFVLLEYYVTAALSSAEAGEITGDGNYNHGEEVTLTATAHEGYKFVNWTENGVVVSEDAEYSFVILKNRNLVANFSSEDIALNVVATAIDDNTIKVEWNAVESAESYNVYRASLTRNSEYEFIANVKETSFTDTELDANTKYFYSVTAVYADGSESEKSESAEATTKPESIEELSLAFNIYPNPVNDKLYIETEVEIEEVSIFDIYGRRQELSAVSCQPSAIDVSNLNSGVYFAKVVTENGETVKRFIKK